MTVREINKHCSVLGPSCSCVRRSPESYLRFWSMELIPALGVGRGHCTRASSYILSAPFPRGRQRCCNSAPPGQAAGSGIPNHQWTLPCSVDPRPEIPANAPRSSTRPIFHNLSDDTLFWMCIYIFTLQMNWKESLTILKPNQVLLNHRKDQLLIHTSQWVHLTYIQLSEEARLMGGMLENKRPEWRREDIDELTFPLKQQKYRQNDWNQPFKSSDNAPESQNKLKNLFKRNSRSLPRQQGCAGLMWDVTIFPPSPAALQLAGRSEAFEALLKVPSHSH